MKLLRIVCLFASAAAVAVAGIDVEPVEFANVTVPAYGGPMCLAKTVGLSPLRNVESAIIVGDGSSADTVAATYEFLHARGANVKVFCARSSQNVIRLENSAVLLRSYYPMGKISCETIDTFFRFTAYNLVVIPDGYAATLPMRRDERTQSLIRDFLTVEGLTNTSVARTLLLVGGAVETLIDSKVIEANDHLSCEANMPYGVTPAITSAVNKRCHEVVKVAQSSDLEFGEKRNILVGTDVSLMLSKFEARYKGSTVPDVRCNSTATTDPFEYETGRYHANIRDLTQSNLNDIAASTDASLVVSNASTAVSDACHNKQGVNFCENAPTSVIVAHGSHARTVRSFANNLNSLPNINKIFCPESTAEHVVEEGEGAFVYLSAEPSFIPTHRVRCTAFHNRTDMLTNTLIVVPGGEVATHRTLRNTNNIVKAFQYATTFSAFGSALTLMTAISNSAASSSGKKEEGEGHLVTNAPYFLNTNVDMSLLGYNSSTATTEEAVMSFRNHEERRTVVLGAYRNPTEFESVVVNFAADAAKALVWENAPNSATDVLVMVYAFGISGLIIIGLLVILCVRAHSSASRNARQARSRGSSTTTEPLASKYA